MSAVWSLVPRTRPQFDSAGPTPTAGRVISHAEQFAGFDGDALRTCRYEYQALRQHWSFPRKTAAALRAA